MKKKQKKLILNECLISVKSVIKTRQNLTSTFLDQNHPKSKY